MRTCKKKRIIAASMLLLPLGAFADDLLVGELKGQFEVNQQGSATYTVPLDLPEGLAGIKPQIGISYNSSVGNGPLGVGWNVAGMSSVHRCESNKDTFGEILAVDFSDNDKLCLDGQPLMLMSGRYGRDGAEYRTQRDNFFRVVGHGDIDDIGSYFSAQTKAGDTLFFGERSVEGENTCAAYALIGTDPTPEAIRGLALGLYYFGGFSSDYEAPDDRSLLESLERQYEDFSISGLPIAGVHRWKQTGTEDSSGNRVSYFYQCNQYSFSGYTSANLPRKIEYKASDSLFNSIEFQYEDREDKYSHAAKGTRELFNTRVSAILVKHGNELISEYKLGYQLSKNTGRSLLTGIRLCKSGLDRCLGQTRFDWSSTTSNVDSLERYIEATSFIPPAPLMDRHQSLSDLMDVNFDGLKDWVLKRAYGEHSEPQVWLNNGSNWDMGNGWSLPVEMTDDSGRPTALFADINSDGYLDILEAREGFTWLYLNNRNGWGASNKIADRPIFRSGYQQADVTDINADGRVDLVFSSVNDQADLVALNAGCEPECSFSYDEKDWWAGNRLFDKEGKRIAQLVDLNFDGAVDFAPLGKGNRSVNVKVNPLGNGEWKWKELKNYRFDLDEGSFADIDADGVADAIRVVKNSYTSIYSIAIHPQHGLYDIQGKPHGKFRPALLRSLYSKSLSAPIFTEVDGDGATDIVVFDGSKTVVLQQSDRLTPNRGSHAPFWHEELTPIQLPQNLFNGKGRPLGTLTDINGDGLADLVLAHKDHPYRIWLNSGTQFGDLVRRISTAFDNEIEISFRNAAEFVQRPAGGSKANSELLYPPVPFKVVDSHTRSSPGGDRLISYSYGDFAIQKPYLTRPGPRGFRWMAITDQSTGDTEKTWYSQQWPTIGAPVRTVAYQGETIAVDNNITTCPNNGLGLLGCTETSHQMTKPTSKTYFTYSAESLSQQYGDEGELASSTVTKQSDIDDFGNIGHVVTTTVDHLLGETFTKDNQNYYDNNEQEWWLGRLMRSEVKHSSPSGTVSKTAAFEYRPDNGVLKAEITEPDRIGTNLYLRKEYEYDDDGLVSQESSWGYHYDGSRMSARTEQTDISYATGKQGQALKIVTTTNGLGHSARKVIDLRHGGVIEYTGPNRITTRWSYDSLGRKTGEYRQDKTETIITRAWPDNEAPSGSAYQITTKSSGSSATTQYFDAQGQIIRKRHLSIDGRVVYEDTEYNALGQMKRSSRPYFKGDPQYWAVAEYDERQRLKTKTVPGPQGPATTRYEYESNSTTVSNPHLHETTTVKNVNGKSVKVTDANLGVLIHTYGVTGELRQTIDPLGQTTRLEYDIHNRKLEMYDPHMGHWSYRYNSFGELEWQRDAEGNEVRLHYDELGRLVFREEPEGPSHWQYDYPQGSNLAQGKANYSVGKLVAVRAPNGYRKNHQYDELGRGYQSTTWHNGESFTLTTEYDEFSRPQVSIRPDGFVVENIYNTLGFLTAIRSPREMAGDYDVEHLATVLQQTLAAAENALQEAIGLEADALYYRQQATRMRQLAQQAAAKAANVKPNAELIAAADRLDEIAAKLETEAEQYLAQAQWANGIVQWIDRLLRSNSLFATGFWGYLFNWIANWYRSYAQARIDIAESKFAQAKVNRRQAEQKRQLAQSSVKPAYWRAKEQEYIKDANANADLAEQALEQANQARQQERRLRAHADLIALNLADDNHAVWWRADQTDAEGRVSRSLVGNGLLTEHFYDPATGVLEGINTGATFRSPVQTLSYEYDNLNNVSFRYDDARGSADSYEYDGLDRIEGWNHQGESAERDSWQYDSVGNISSSDSVGSYSYQTNAYNGKALVGTDAHGEIHYSANGHTTDRGDQHYQWTSFGKPELLSNGQHQSQFRYGPDRARYQQLEINSGEDSYQRSSYYVGKLYEKITTDRSGTKQTQRKHYLYAGKQLIGVHTRFGVDDSLATTGAQTRYFHKDALGSISAITDQRGNTVAQYRYKPFGEQVTLEKLDHTDQIYAAGFAPVTTRGYTGHEHLSKLNLIHMNGRVYDPTLARFLSADPNIQAPNNAQNYNRYSYVVNNPLKYTDPSGYFLKKIFGWLEKFSLGFRLTTEALRRSSMFRTIGSIVTAVIGTVFPVLAWLPVLYQAHVTYAMGGSSGDILRGAAIAAASMYVSGKIKGGFDAAASASGGSAVAVEAGRAVAHGVAQGVLSEAGGGRFKDGFVAGSAASAAGHLGMPEGIADSGKVGRTAYVAVIGGTVSQVSGGKFANGAITAAFVHLYNYEHGRMAKARKLMERSRIARRTQATLAKYREGPSLMHENFGELALCLAACETRELVNTIAPGVAQDYALKGLASVVSGPALYRVVGRELLLLPGRFISLPKTIYDLYAGIDPRYELCYSECS